MDRDQGPARSAGGETPGRTQHVLQPCKMRQAMPDHNYFANLIWQIADLLRGPYRPREYERVMLPMTVLRRFDCVLARTKAKVLTEYKKHQGSGLKGDALDRILNKAAGERFHNHSPLDFEKLKDDPDHIK